MYLFTEYQTRHSGIVGQADPANIEVRDGVQYVNPATSATMLAALENLCIDDAKSTSAGANALRMVAQQLGTAKVDGSACDERAITKLRDEGGIVMVNMTTFSPIGMELVVAYTPDEVPAVAGEGTNYAVLSLAPAVLEPKEKVETTTLLLGAVAGGALGFVTIGPVGGVGGAVGGALIANWLA